MYMQHVQTVIVAGLYSRNYYGSYMAIYKFLLNDYCLLLCRGYGDTEKPAHKRDYKIEDLTQDIAELIPALGYKSCVLVAHDWGGILAWYVQKYICSYSMQHFNYGYAFSIGS